MAYRNREKTLNTTSQQESANQNYNEVSSHTFLCDLNTKFQDATGQGMEGTLLLPCAHICVCVCVCMWEMTYFYKLISKH